MLASALCQLSHACCIYSAQAAFVHKFPNGDWAVVVVMVVLVQPIGVIGMIVELEITDGSAAAIFCNRHSCRIGLESVKACAIVGQILHNAGQLRNIAVMMIFFVVVFVIGL